MAQGGKVGQVAVWVLLVALIIGLAGFGITGFGTSLRAIGSVGEVEIDADDYARNIQQEMNALAAQIGRPATFPEAQALGVDRNVLRQLVTTAALDDMAREVGLSIGDANLAAEIRAMPAFGGLDGKFDRDAYRSVLDQNRLSEPEFEDRMRADIARGLMQGAIAEGFPSAPAHTDLIFAHGAERRAFSLLRLTEADLDAQPPAADDSAVRAHYDANPDRYTLPERRRVRYASLTPEMLSGGMTVDEAALRAAYDERIDEYVIPERRLVDRLGFADSAAAEAALAEISAGQRSFDDYVSERGLSPADIDMGDVGREDLGAGADGVFGAEAGAVVGPFDSAIGPVLYRLNGILAAQETTFEDARPALVEELALDAARREIATRIDKIEDLLAGGAALEDLVSGAGMETGTLDLAADSREGLAAYPAFREKAGTLQPGDFAELVELDDGAIAVLEVAEIIPATLQPFEEVVDQARAAADAEALAAALRTRRDAILAEIQAGAALGGFGIVSVNPGITRQGYIDGAPPTVVRSLFDLESGAAAAIDDRGYVGIVVLDAIIPADPETEEAKALRQAIAERTAQEISQDAFALFVRSLENRAEIRLNQTAIEAINAQMR
jgi:peptidyl-prolyl cis-trans isomerase D